MLKVLFSSPLWSGPSQGLGKGSLGFIDVVILNYVISYLGFCFSYVFFCNNAILQQHAIIEQILN